MSDTDFSGTSLLALLFKYARPVRKGIAGVVSLTLLSNALLMLQPLILAAILSQIMGVGVQAPPASASPFDLNAVGGAVTQWIGAFGELSLGWALGVLGALYLAQSLGASIADYGAHAASLKVEVNSTKLIQSDLMRHLLSLDLGFFLKQQSGALMSRVTQDAAHAGHLLGPLVKGLLHHATQLAVYGAYLFSTSAWLTVGAALIIVVHFTLTQFLKRPIRRLSRGIYDAQADFSTALQESLLGIRVAKSFGAERFELMKVNRGLEGIASATMRRGRIEGIEPPVRRVLDALGVIGIVFVAGMQLRAGALTVPGFLLYVYIGRMVIAPANHLATYAVWGQSLLAAFERIRELCATRPQVVDGAMPPGRFEERLEAKGLSFSYGDVPAIRSISLEIRKGERVAFVGPSGGGKSTLVDLLLRLYDPDAGEILMDGVNIKALRHAEYRRLFGVVSQECLLFHDTVRNNIRYGRQELRDEDIEEAARIANAHDFIHALPDGYQTVVGDRGVRLSGGERQRVAIARAVAHNPQILILDEATSALDSESERAVQRAIESITEGTTAIIIAHRLSTVLHAEKIVVIDRGRIVDVGRHGELLGRCELYQRLCSLQFDAGDGRPAAEPDLGREVEAPTRSWWPERP